jgi:5'-nucleotidase
VSFILVTNDDGVEAPALVPLVRALGALAPVRAVVPDRERSWVGKAITRWDEVRVERVERAGVELLAVGGFPADCTQLGVHSLFGERPDMVVSGINIGFNHGLAFLLSSGTVGAAAEGWIAGIPALAFSTGVLRGHREWAPFAWGDASDALWARAAALAADVVRRVREAGFPDGVDVLSVNFPESADVGTPRVVTDLARVAYDQLFQPRGEGVYVHEFGGGFRHAHGLGGTDLEAAERGLVSITPIRLAHTAAVPPAFRRALEAS